MGFIAATGSTAATCGPCVSLCTADAATPGYTVCPAGSSADTSTLAGTCDFSALYALIETNHVTATFLNAMSTGAAGTGSGATGNCAARKTFLQCRSVTAAVRAANLVIDSACTA